MLETVLEAECTAFDLYNNAVRKVLLLIIINRNWGFGIVNDLPRVTDEIELNLTQVYEKLRSYYVIVYNYVSKKIKYETYLGYLKESRTERSVGLEKGLTIKGVWQTVSKVKACILEGSVSSYTACWGQQSTSWPRHLFDVWGLLGIDFMD